MPKTPNSDSQLMPEALQEALKSGYRASKVLESVLAEVSQLNCAEAGGFEGPNTYADCGKCITCLAKEVTSKIDHENLI